MKRFQSAFLPFFLCMLLIGLVGNKPAQADLVIPAHAAESGLLNLPTAFFRDETGSNSVIQAQMQFQNMRATLPPQSQIDFGKQEGAFWLELNITNNSRTQRWYLELPTVKPSMPSPIKSISIYNPEKPEKPLVVWPQLQKKSAGRISLPLSLPSIQTTSRYVLVETWPGIQNPVTPVLKTAETISEENSSLAQKLSLLWLVMGAVCGAGFIQLILTRQLLQGMLALNALLLGTGVFFLQRPDLIPGITNFHPMMLPLAIACLLGIGASLMLWVASRRYTSRATLSVLPILLNITLIMLAVAKFDLLTTYDLSLESLPTFTLTVTGMLLLIITLALSFSEITLIWFMPAWIALAAMPWVSVLYPFAAPIAYSLLLTLSGVNSVFTYWKSMDKETESLQKRLRQELKNIKHQYDEDNKNWERKMENERGLLNELRYREQQRSAELEIARKEADAANQAKSDFLAIISHEIRTPMTGIMGVIDLVRQTSINEEQREYVDVIKNSGDTMLTLLNDILDYSKIEKGVIDLENIPFALRTLVKSVATLMSGRAKEKGLSIDIQIEDNVPDNLIGDPSRIRQILLNLVGNAIKFTREGRVTIHIAVQPEKRAVAVTTLLFEVIDTGIGISKEAQSKLFKAYAQADASISRRFGGTGLGLTICRMLVGAMKGTIDVKSTPDQGSTFWFTLPLTIAEDAVAALEARQDDNYTPEKIYHILVIDDNAVNLKVTRGLLEMDGHKVTTADSAQEALDMIDASDVDVIFVDMLMPDMDGKTFVGKLRHNLIARIANLPVFALTGLNDPENKRRINELGMAGLLIKPVSKQALRDALSSIPKTPAAPAPAPVAETKPDSVDTLLSRIGQLSDTERKKIIETLAPAPAPLKQAPAPVTPVVPPPVAEAIPAPIVEQKHHELVADDNNFEEPVEQPVAVKEPKKPSVPIGQIIKEKMEALEIPKMLNSFAVMMAPKPKAPKPPKEEKPAAKAKVQQLLTKTEEIEEDYSVEEVTEDQYAYTEEQEEAIDEIVEEVQEEEPVEEEKPAPAPAAPAKPQMEILNTAMLNDLKSSLPPDTFKEIFDELVAKAEELIHLIEEALQAEDMDDLTEKAHNLKGMAGNFGLNYLMKYAAELENYGRHYQRDKAAKMLNLGPGVLEKTLTTLDQWLKNH